MGEPGAEACGTSRWGWLALAPLAVFALGLHQLIGNGGAVWRGAWTWFPSLGVELAFRVDGLALKLVLLVSGIGAAVLLYAAGYLAGTPQRGRLFGWLLAFMVAMLGCVTADNLIVLFLFWEATSVTSFMLVGFKHQSEAARAAARQALLVTGAGGLCLLAGFVLLGEVGGTYTVSRLVESAPLWRDDPRALWAMLLLIAGAFTKSAQLPFHFWLPNAMAAPTPVSAYLHSATMVKLGVYLLARFDSAFGGDLLWQHLLVQAGMITSVWAIVLTLRERDLKRILAWSTVSALGTLVMLIGLPGDGPALAFGAFLLAHALYKAPLFFVAGNVDHCTGSRDIDRVRGLAPRMPWTAAAAALAALSMAGMPFSLGFVAKDLIGEAKVQGAELFWLCNCGALVNAISVAVAAVAAIRVFWHRGGEEIPAELHEASWAMRLPPLAIAVLGITLGTLPWLASPLVEGTVLAIAPTAPGRALPQPLSEGPTLLALLVAVSLGVGVYVFWDRLHRQLERLLRPLDPFSATAWYERALAGLATLAAAVTTRLQSGRLSDGVLWLAASVAAALAAAVAYAWPLPLPQMAPPTLAVGGACGLLLVGSLGAVVMRRPFVLLLVAGLTGLGSALLFLFLGAPDPAFTQLAVEVAFVVVIGAILLRMGRLGARPAREAPWLPRAVAALLIAGLTVVLVLAATAGAPQTSLADYFAGASVSEANGRNVVNAILVDFRGLDTLGEIAVIAITLLAATPLVAALARRRGTGAR